MEKKRGLQKKHIPWVAGGVLGLIFVVWLIFGNHSSTYRADSRTVSIGTVTREQFNDYVRVSGQVQPITTVQLNPLEGGVVERLVVEEGARVRRGDVIVELSNPALNLSILDSEAQLAEKQNFLRNTQVTMEQERLNLRQEKLQLDLDVARKERAWRQNQKLYEEQLIRREDYLQAREDWELAVQRRELVMERQKQDSIYRSVQVEQMEESLENMHRNMQLIRQRVDNLRVTSPIDGELGMLDVVLGQSLSSGQKMGQINDLSDFKVEASIDEHYIDQVRPGLSATFERGETTYPLVIRRVYPEVRVGQFRVDFTFDGDRPENIRTGQTYYINLQLGQPTEAVMIPRGAFYQATGGAWIFVVDPSGEQAHKRRIRIGRQNPQYYEVTEGLEPGEKVITSSYDGFGKNERIILR